MTNKERAEITYKVLQEKKKAKEYKKKEDLRAVRQRNSNKTIRKAMNHGRRIF